MRKEQITLACMSTPRLDNLKRLLPKTLPFMDKAIIVIGRHDKEAEDYLMSLGDKVKIVYNPWNDSFADQWNQYLPHVNEGWVLICDDDEVPSDGMLNSLDQYVNDSNFGEKYCCVKFQSNPISEGQDMGPSKYYREIFFRYLPRMKYYGGPVSGCHQYIVGYQNGRLINSDFVYYHIKSLREEYCNAARNYYIYGIWPHGATDGQRREEWNELRSIINKHYPHVGTFMELNDEMIKGNMHQDFKDWMDRTWSKFETHNEYNEFRAFCTYYKKYLHPEEYQG